MAFNPQEKWSVLCKGRVTNGMKALAHEACVSVAELLDMSYAEFTDRLKAVRHEGLTLRGQK